MLTTRWIVLGLLLALLLCAPAQAAVVGSVQSGTTTLSAGSASTTAAITAVDTGKAFLVFSVRINDSDPQYSQITGQLTNATTVTFQRDSGFGSPSATIEWYVVEFTSGVSVQRGSATMSTTTVNQSITAVDTGKSFPLISYRNSGTIYGNDDFVRGRLTSGSNLELSAYGSNVSGIVEWQVVEFTGASVQSGDLSFGTTQSSKTATITSVDTTKSWLIYNYKSDNGTSSDIGQKLVRGQLTNATTLTFDRNRTGQAIDLSWFLVEFTDGTTVQRGSQNMGTGTTQSDVAITSVNTGKTIAAGGYFGRGGRSSYSSDDNPGVGWATFDLTSATNLRITRALTGSSTADFGWFVVQFASDATAPATVSNLATGTVTDESIQLTWTAPGDDNTTGTATTYDIRYRTDAAITAGNWDSATQVSGEPGPSVAGSAESFTVTGLTGGTQYYFAIKTADEVPNWSGVSNSPNATTSSDATAPSAITNLSTSNATETTVDLSWRAPGDDASTGTASSYDIRYSTSAITDGNWASATQVSGEPTPTAANTTQGMTVTGLSPGTTYWFAIKAADEVPNTSALSNVPSIATTGSDTTAPSKVLDLAVTGNGTSSLDLSWTAPGDDYGIGTATSYDIRYSTSAITEGNWASATQATGEPAPSVAGSTETFTLTGLSAATTYYVAIKAVDEVPNTGSLSDNAVGTTSSTSSLTIHPSGAASGHNASCNSNVSSDLDTNNGSTCNMKDTNNDIVAYMDNPTPTGSVVSITLYARVRDRDGKSDDQIRFGLRLVNGGTTYWGNTVNNVSTTETLINGGTWILDPSDSSDWTWTDMDNLIIYLDNTNGRTEYEVDEAYFEITYTTADSTAPNAVSDLATGSINPTTVTLSWTSPGDDGASGTASGYDIRYATSPITAGNWANASQVSGEPSPSIAGSSESYVVTGLSENTTYYFAIKTADETPNWSSVSNSPSATTTISDSTAPAAVADLAASNPGASSIDLDWTAPGDDGASGTATAYDIRYRTDGAIDAGNWDSAVQVDGEPGPSVAGSAESFTVTDLVGSTTYYFAIKTVDDNGNWSGLSNSPSGTTSGDGQAPSNITDLAAGNATNTTIDLDWTAPGDDGTTGTATTYDIRYRTDAAIDAGNWASATQVNGEPSPSAYGTAESFTVTGLTPGTTYYFAIRAADDVTNWNAVSNSPSLATTNVDETAPSQITDLAVTATAGTTVDLAWTAVGDDGASGTATSYDIRYSTSAITAGNWASATQASGEPAPQAAGSSESFQVTGLTASTTYYFAVKAIDDNGNAGALSNVPSGVTSADPPPGQVVDLAQSANSASSISLTWTASGEDNYTGTATSYDVRYSTSAITEANWASATQATGEPSPAAAYSSESFTVTGLSAATTYYFAVKVRDAAGNWSSLSNVISGVTASASSTLAIHPSGAASGNGANCNSNVSSDLDTNNGVYCKLKDSSEDVVAYMDNPTPTGTVDSITIYARVRDRDGKSDDRIRFGIKLVNGGTTYWGNTIINVSTTETLYNGGTWTTDPSDGQAWTWTDMDNLISHLENINGSAEFEVDELYIEIAYSTDATAPAAVSDLTAGNATSSSVLLSWTAPGDDDASGRATSYDIRYRTDAPITDANWATATAVAGEPAPANAGATETFTVTGLSQSTTYYFAIKTADEVPNTSTISNSPSATTTAADATAPAAVSNLAVSGSPTGSTVTLTWTAPGDDTNSGTASSYDVRYSTSAINDGNWASATQATGEPMPSAAGSTEYFTVTGLSASTTYYFAVKTADEVPNTSGISNSPSGTTAAGGTCNVAASGTYIEAENFTGTISQGSSTFSVATATGGYNGGGYLLSGSPGGTTTPPTEQGKQYTLNFPTTGTYKVWIRGHATDGTTDSIFVGLDGSWTGALNENGVYNSWTWSNGIQAGANTISVGSSGVHTFNVWVREAGHKLDGIYLTTGAETPSGGIPSGATVINPTSCAGPTDTIAPAAVSDLAAGSATTSSITLSWTAPGDDNTVGTASSYDIRYSTSAITAANWAYATQATGEPAPRVAGSSESFTVGGLAAGTTYYFAIKSKDEVPNTSGLSNVVSLATIDPPVGGYTADNVIPQAQVSQATDGSGTVTITWKGRDNQSDGVTLKNFEFSVDGGTTWAAPGNDDASAALSANWTNNGSNWSTATTLGAASAHSFTFTTKHGTVSGLAGVDQSDVQVRFKLNDGTADSVSYLTSESFRVDNSAPTATITSSEYDADTDTLTITGSNFTTIAAAATDIKSYVNWAKFKWDINGDNATSGFITFVLGDVTSLTVTDDTTLTLVFTGAKGSAIEASAGYGSTGGNDKLDVSIGFVRDGFGNASITDAVANAPLVVNDPPVGGYSADNVIPAAQISQATDGSGLLTIKWKGRDNQADNVTLKTFEYSVDGGSTWNAPTNGDASAALSADWSDDGGSGWSTAVAFADAAFHSFTLNTKHADLSGLDGVDQSDVQVRFKLNDGEADSAGFVTSASVRVDDAAPTATIISASYNAVTNAMTITGTNFTTIAPASTDIKGYVDWSKFVWDINGDDATTANISVLLSDVSGLTIVDDTTLTLEFTAAKAETIEGNADYSVNGGADTLDIAAGFTADDFGNAATTDAVADGPLGTVDPPIGGYVDDNAIPSAQITQATDSSGIITINWKGRDNQSDNVTLSGFEYSVDGGSSWNAPANGDASAALSANWADNGGGGWSTATTLAAATAHSFTLDTQHADLSGLNGVDQDDVMVRFLLNDGSYDSDALLSAPFQVDNAAPTVTITNATYDAAGNTLTITGTNFTTIAAATTDIKAYADWSKFVWDINGDDATTANIGFVLGDVTSLTVTDDTTLTLVFTAAKGAAIEGTAGYGSADGADTLDVTTGFAKDAFGNVATTDGVADGALTIPSAVITATKLSSIVSDPLNGATNPKRIPGAVIEYSISPSNTGDASPDADSVIVTDVIDTASVEFDATTGVSFTDGATSSALALGAVSYSDDPAPGPYTYDYTPVPDGDGYDAAVTSIKITTTGTFAYGGNPAPGFAVTYRLRVK